MSEGLIGSRNREVDSLGKILGKLGDVMTSSSQARVQEAIEQMYDILRNADGIEIDEGFRYHMRGKLWEDALLIGFVINRVINRWRDKGYYPVDNEFAYFAMPSEETYVFLNSMRTPELMNVYPERMNILTVLDSGLIGVRGQDEGYCVFHIPKDHSMRKEAEDMIRRLSKAAKPAGITYP